MGHRVEHVAQARRSESPKSPSRGEPYVKAPEVTPRNPVGRVKVSKIFTLNSFNYHPDKAYMRIRIARFRFSIANSTTGRMKLIFTKSLTILIMRKRIISF